VFGPGSPAGEVDGVASTRAGGASRGPIPTRPLQPRGPARRRKQDRTARRIPGRVLTRAVRRTSRRRTGSARHRVRPGFECTCSRSGRAQRQRDGLGTTWTNLTTISATRTEDASRGIATGNCYRYTLTGTDHVGNAASISTIVRVDPTAPTFGSPDLTFSASGNNAYYSGSGTAVYYNGNTGTSSSFTVSAPNVADRESGIQNVIFPTFSGFTGGGTDSSSPFSSTYTWSSSTAGGAQTVTATNGIGTSATSPFSLARDVTAPSGGALTVNGTAAAATATSSFNTTGSFAIGTRTDYAETQGGTASGLGSSSLVRTRATLNGDGTCGTFGSPVTISDSPTQDAAAGISDGNCYQYTLTGSDNVNNSASVSTIVKVDATAPTISTLTLSDGGGGAIAGTIEQKDIRQRDVLREPRHEHPVLGVDGDGEPEPQRRDGYRDGRR